MDIQLFLDMLKIDSTTGREGEFAQWLAARFAAPGRRILMSEVESMQDVCAEGCPMPKNLMVTWGDNPKVIFCSHMDTVPPYIPPTVVASTTPGGMPLGAVTFGDWGSDTPGAATVYGEDEVLQHRAIRVSEVFAENRSNDGTRLPEADGMPLGAVTLGDWGSDTPGAATVYGRGTCDAKGQIFAMYETCCELEKRGHKDFALLLLAGEETGSFGAKAFNAEATSAALSGPSPMVIVAEPTDNCMATAAKGTKAFEVTFTGEAFHSGYPQYGRSAVLMFNDFINALRSIVFPKDALLGDTTWNVGRLVSDNPQNILSDRLSCRVYFRTTFESDEMVCNVMRNMAGPEAKLRFGRPMAQDGADMVAKELSPWQKFMSVKEFGGDAPTRFETLPGFPCKPVSFGSDAPQLKCFEKRILCGPGSILVAHRDDEQIRLDELETAIENYIRMYEVLIAE